MKLIYSKSIYNAILLMYLMISKFRFLEFPLLFSRFASYLQFVTTNCLIRKSFFSLKKVKMISKKLKGQGLNSLADLPLPFHIQVFL
jgi:hypothetical protein